MSETPPMCMSSSGPPLPKHEHTPPVPSHKFLLHFPSSHPGAGGRRGGLLPQVAARHMVLRSHASGVMDEAALRGAPVHGRTHPAVREGA